MARSRGTGGGMNPTPERQSRLFCTFELDGQTFGLELRHVQQVSSAQPVTPVALAPESVVGLINLRGQLAPAIDLRRRLGLRERPRGAAPMVVVACIEDATFCLLVDQMGDLVDVGGDQFQTMPETVDPAFRRWIEGVYRLEPGLLLALDAARLVDLHCSTKVAEESAA